MLVCLYVCLSACLCFNSLYAINSIFGLCCIQLLLLLLLVVCLFIVIQENLQSTFTVTNTHAQTLVQPPNSFDLILHFDLDGFGLFIYLVCIAPAATAFARCFLSLSLLFDSHNFFLIDTQNTSNLFALRFICLARSYSYGVLISGVVIQ